MTKGKWLFQFTPEDKGKAYASYWPVDKHNPPDMVKVIKLAIDFIEAVWKKYYKDV